jgi:hypothetical protein
VSFNKQMLNMWRYTSFVLFSLENKIKIYQNLGWVQVLRNFDLFFSHLQKHATYTKRTIIGFSSLQLKYSAYN